MVDICMCIGALQLQSYLMSEVRVVQLNELQSAAPRIQQLPLIGAEAEISERKHFDALTTVFNPL